MEVGESPVIESIPEATVKIGENLNFTVKASSVNEKNFTFSASDLPEGASFDETGIFSWTPSEGQEGIYTVYFEANNGMFSDSEVATIDVIEEKVPLNLSSVEEVPMNLSNICDSCLSKVSQEGFSYNKLFSFWGND